MLESLMGLNLQTILAAIAGLGIVIGGAWMRISGAKAERNKRAAQDARAYREGRTNADNADLGHGASDIERIKRLQSFADKR
jgi:hypothetical protein